MKNQTPSYKDLENKLKLLVNKNSTNSKELALLLRYNVDYYQVVAGTNFVFTVHVGDNKHVLVKAFRPLPHTKEPMEVTEV